MKMRDLGEMGDELDGSGSWKVVGECRSLMTAQGEGGKSSRGIRALKR